MSYSAVIAELKNVREHPNADRLMLGDVLGFQVIVGLDAVEGEIGIYFPSGGQLSEEYASANDLVRRKDIDGNNTGGMFCEKRRIRIMRLRKEVSDGYFAPLSSISGLDKMAVGFEFTEWNDLPVCNKYIVNPKQAYANRKGSEIDMRWRILPRWLRLRLRKSFPMPESMKARCKVFRPHFDTSQLQRELERLTEGDVITITEKIHGTSARVGNLPVSVDHGIFKRLFSRLFGLNLQTFEDQILVGTRRVVRGELKDMLETNFRRTSVEGFASKLKRGETVYGELVGWEDGGKTIMPSISAKKLGKKFKKYLNSIDGNVMDYSYGAERGKVKFFVYRITRLNTDFLDEDPIELSWKDLKARAEELEIEAVPEMGGFVYDGDPEKFLDICDQLKEGESTIDSSHIREGVVIRAENETGMFCLKHKSIDFKIFEGILQDEGVVDPEDLA